MSHLPYGAARTPAFRFNPAPSRLFSQGPWGGTVALVLRMRRREHEMRGDRVRASAGPGTAAPQGGW
jgi:hypothetical protein